ncbi:MAG: metallopeptidase family protein [Notoacmeibacter sp.]
MGSARYPSSAWQSMRAPSVEDFEALARGAWEAMPARIANLCGDLEIRVADFPRDDLFEELDIETPFDVLCLFEGVDPSQPLISSKSNPEPSIFHIYRRPILDYWAEHEEMLGDIVAYVMIREIGQFFGLTDDDIEAIELRA